ncbi:MAG: response regulator [Elainellaceae cyanobacterium]
MVSDPRANILLVDDQPENLLALEAILGELNGNLVKATSGEKALRCLLSQDFAVILLDVQMPDMDGFEVAKLIRQRQRSRETPIIFLTAFSTSEPFLFKGYALGAVDYLIKPIAPNVLKSKVAVFIDLFNKTKALQQQTAQLEAINTELQMSEERFRSLSTCSPVGVFVTDVSGTCTYTNPRFQTVCGFSTSSELSSNWLKAVHPDDCDRATATWLAYLQTGQEYLQEFRFQTENGKQRWAQVRAARMLSDQGKFLGHVGTIEDISERKQAEAAAAQIMREQVARQEAEAANRMKDEFIAILSHELRTPLNSILGWSRLLHSRKCDESMVSRAIDIIERNAKSQAKLIEDILDVSQIVRGKLQLNCYPVNLTSITQSTLETVQPLAEAKEIVFSSNLADYPNLRVLGDSGRLEQVIWNLLTNAVKFTPPGGKIEVRLDKVVGHHASANGKKPNLSPITSHPLPIANAPPSITHYAQLQVIDSGIGINSEFLPYVFDRFCQADSTTTRSHGGLGLGLSIVRYLVEQHQGLVYADSQGEGQGATFTIQIPLLLEAEQGNGKPDTNSDRNGSQDSRLSNLHVFIVDDDPDAQEFLAFLLQNEGATVSTASSATEALQILESLEPALLLCDISMPDMDGYSLIRKIRTQLPEPQAQIPAIALTAHARVSDQEQALTAGFQKHFPKPIDPDQLLEAIEQVIAGNWQAKV